MDVAPDQRLGACLIASSGHSSLHAKLAVPTLKLHPVHGGPSQCRSIEPLAEEVVAAVAAVSASKEKATEEDCSVTIVDNALEVRCADFSLKVQLIRTEVRPGPMPRTLVLKRLGGAAGPSTNRGANKPVPVEVMDGGSETYLCRGCLSRSLSGFRCCLADASRDAVSTLRRRPAQQHFFCPKCAAQDVTLSTWLFEVDCSDIDGMDEETAMQAMYAALAEAGASRTDLDSSYEVSEKELGRGANAVVHRAKRRKPLRTDAEDGVVVKFVNAGPVEEVNKEYCNIMQEVLVLAAVQGHPSILGFHGLFSAPVLENSPWPSSARYAVMTDFYSGGDLWDAVKARVWTEEQAGVVIQDLLSALAHVHAVGFVHRDVKLENIMLTSDNHGILADFGLACISTDRAEMKRRCGSAGYCAPEIIEGELYNETVDIFAAGVVSYAMLVGCMPFAGANTDDVFEKTIRCRIKFDVGKQPRSFSRSCKSFVRHLLRKVPDSRPSCQQALCHVWLRPDLEENREATEDGRRTSKDSRFTDRTTCPESTRFSSGPGSSERVSERWTQGESRDTQDLSQADHTGTSCDEQNVFDDSSVAAPSQPRPGILRRLKGSSKHQAVAGRSEPKNHRFKATETKRLSSELGAQVLNKALGKTGVPEMTGRSQTRVTNLVALVEEPAELEHILDNVVKLDGCGDRATAPQRSHVVECATAPEPVLCQLPMDPNLTGVLPGPVAAPRRHSCENGSRAFPRRLRFQAKQHPCEPVSASSDAASSSSSVLAVLGQGAEERPRPATSNTQGIIEQHAPVKPMVAKPDRHIFRRVLKQTS